MRKRGIVPLGGILVSLALLIGACGESATPPPPQANSYGSCKPTPNAGLTLVVGKRANVPDPKLPPQIQDLAEQVATAHADIRLVRIDGRPGVAFGEPAPDPAPNGPADAQAVAKYLEGVRHAFATKLAAVHGEADVLGALSLAARASRPGETIVVVDSGLQTTGTLRFNRDRLLEAEPSEITKYLRDNALLPDLHGRTVLLVGVGETAPPQQPLENNHRATLTSIWRGVVEGAGASCVAAVDHPNSTAPTAHPPVSPVALPSPPPPRVCGVIEIGADDVGFLPDTATFRDPTAAKEVMARFAQQARQVNRRVELVGTTATDGSEAGRLRLSRQRAAAVRDVLVELGVPADRVSARGVGSNWPKRVPDIGPNGELLPGPAAQNRKVIMTIHCGR